jgi:sigma-B regulation protein RsbU (phosphoserine phosphatase)
MPKLFIYPEKGVPYSFDLQEKKIGIGRSAGNEVRLRDSCCSSFHASIFPTARGYAVKDMGSKNGTRLNGERVSGERELKRGDDIIVGSTHILFDRARSPKEASDSAALTNTVISVDEILRDAPRPGPVKGAGRDAGRAKDERDERIMDILQDVDQALFYDQPEDKLLDHIMNIFVRHIPMDRGILMLKKGPGDELSSEVIKVPGDPQTTKGLPISQSIIRTALDKKAELLVSDINADESMRKQQSVVLAKIHSAMCVPMWDDKEIIGVIYSDRLSVDKMFDQADLRLLILLAHVAAVKITNMRQRQKLRADEDLRKQQAQARIIQQNLLPQSDPVFEPFDISGGMRACYQVGGDYFDFLPIEPARLGIVIADVAGKGTGAALLMAYFSGSLLVESKTMKNLAEMSAKLNNIILRKSESHVFISFFMGILNPENEEMTYVNAGHNPPIILSTAGGVQKLDGTGFCLGMFPDVTYKIGTVRLWAGDLLCVYTDGIVERRDRNSEPFGEGRLIETLLKCSGLPARDGVSKIFEAIDAFSENLEPDDDMTLIILKRGG